MWLQVGPPGLQSSVGMALGHLTMLPETRPQPAPASGPGHTGSQPAHLRSLIFVSSNGSVELKAWCHGLPLSYK